MFTFTAPEPHHVRDAFRQIVGETTIKCQDILIDAYLMKNPSGDREELELFQGHIGASDWNWPWFDAWRDHFAVSSEWPYMWREYGRAWSGFLKHDPDSYRECLRLIDWQDVRVWLKQSPLAPRPFPKTKTALIDFMLASVPWEDFSSFGNAAYTLAVTKHRQVYHAWTERERLKILIHALMIRLSSLEHIASWRDARDRYSLSLKKRWITPNPLEGCQICRTNVAVGPIDLEIAFPTGHFAPPAFPGCRCCLCAHSDEWKSRKA